jgi:hypothetical protein
MLGIIFWIILILSALGGGWYWRAQPFAPGVGVVLLLLAMLGWKVFPIAL